MSALRGPKTTMRNAAAAAMLLFAGAGAASCHERIPPAATPYTVTGRVESVDAGALSLRHKSGRRLIIVLAGDTAVTHDGHPAAPADIAAGMRVVVVYHFAEDVAVADEVRLFRGPINYP
jgi:hypothetical protein